MKRKMTKHQERVWNIYTLKGYISRMNTLLKTNTDVEIRYHITRIKYRTERLIECLEKGNKENEKD